MNQTPTTIAEALAAPFAASEVRFKPGAVSGNRAWPCPTSTPAR